jgi:hypothetical protein
VQIGGVFSFEGSRTLIIKKKILVKRLIKIVFSTRIYFAIFVYRFTITKKLLNILLELFRLGSRSITKFIIIFFYFLKNKRSDYKAL